MVSSKNFAIAASDLEVHSEFRAEAFVTCPRPRGELSHCGVGRDREEEGVFVARKSGAALAHYTAKSKRPRGVGDGSKQFQ